MMEAPSFASRRPATTNLPAFSLPPPDIPSTRYPNHASAFITSPSSRSAGPRVPSLLTMTTPPPFSQSTTSKPSTSTNNTNTTAVTSNLTYSSSGATSDGLSPSPGVNSGSSQASQAGGAPSMFYGNHHHMSGSWPGPGGSQHSSYTYANPNNSTPNSGSLGQTSYSQRPPLYGQISPSLPQQYAQRTSSSPATGDNLPHPPYNQEQSAFPTPIGGGGGGGPPGSSHSQQSGLAQSMHTPTGPQPPTPGQNTSGGPPSAQESGAYRAPPTPNSFFPPSTTPQQSSFPSFPGPPPQQSPTVQSPTTTSGGAPRGLVSLSSGMAPPPMGYGGGRGHHMPPITYAHYGQMNGGPVLSNMHQPGGQLAMVGGMPGMGSPYGHHPGMAPHHHSVYLGHSNGPSQQQDRPFKCDQCPQSFNRNHDLKRHKRIHLAVKPFPCSNCDKSFSRKDALKRHKLVKGCGDKENNNSGNNGTTGTNDASPPDRSDVMSDDTDGSPRMVKKE